MHCCLAEDLALHSARCPVGDQRGKESPQHCELQIQTYKNLCDHHHLGMTVSGKEREVNVLARGGP